jgi:hypothetical protein
MSTFMMPDGGGGGCVFIFLAVPPGRAHSEIRMSVDHWLSECWRVRIILGFRMEVHSRVGCLSVL